MVSKGSKAGEGLQADTPMTDQSEITTKWVFLYFQKAKYFIL